ncbi:hypothetical protein MMC08_006299, partial [Hypocenomyce scalaris]|nr:hypothetical protein [Hypocenomyce scalaris]
DERVTFGLFILLYKRILDDQRETRFSKRRHQVIANACLTYLNLPAFSKPCSDDDVSAKYPKISAHIVHGLILGQIMSARPAPDPEIQTAAERLINDLSAYGSGAYKQPGLQTRAAGVAVEAQGDELVRVEERVGGNAGMGGAGKEGSGWR